PDAPLRTVRNEKHLVLGGRAARSGVEDGQLIRALVIERRPPPAARFIERRRNDRDRAARNRPLWNCGRLITGDRDASETSRSEEAQNSGYPRPPANRIHPHPL